MVLYGTRNRPEKSFQYVWSVLYWSDWLCLRDCIQICHFKIQTISLTSCLLSCTPSPFWLLSEKTNFQMGGKLFLTLFYPENIFIPSIYNTHLNFNISNNYPNYSGRPVWENIWDSYQTPALFAIYRAIYDIRKTRGPWWSYIAHLSTPTPPPPPHTHTHTHPPTPSSHVFFSF